VRILHTSDWHLGRRLCDVPLLEEQAHALEQVYQACREERVDALVVAGDVYDRAVPPEDAVRLLSDFASRVTRGLGIPLVAISGNHDSAERLGFGAELLEGGRLFLRTRFDSRARPIPVGEGPEAGLVYCLPYTEPDAARFHLRAEREAAAGEGAGGEASAGEAAAEQEVRSHDAAVRGALAAARADRAARGGRGEARARNAVLVGHLFAQGGVESQDSERPLVMGGASTVGADALEGWAYVALGHLHAPQAVGGREDVRYSGSLLKYSFGEASHRKGVTLVEVAGGGARVRPLPLTPRRDVVRLEGSFEELLHAPRFAFAEGAFVEATFTDAGYLVDVAPRLRARFPHLLTAVPRLLLEGAEGGEGGPRAEPRLEDARALLEGFWGHVAPGLPLEEAHREAFARVVARLERAQTLGAEERGEPGRGEKGRGETGRGETGRGAGGEEAA
jgi:exonuclease SbcD